MVHIYGYARFGCPRAGLYSGVGSYSGGELILRVGSYSG